MVLKLLSLVCLLAMSHSQETKDSLGTIVSPEDLDHVIAVDPSSTPVTTAKEVSNSSGGKKDCKLWNGEPGICTVYYQCTATIKSDETAGPIIDELRPSENACESYLDTCCAPKDISTPTTRSSPPPEPKREGCGWHNSDGVGFHVSRDSGEEAKFGEFPWVCAVLKLTNASEPLKASHKYVGGGTLIHPSVVLTSAHVISTGTLLVRSGEWDTQSDKEVYPHQDREVASVQVHKDYNKHTLFYDVAVLFLVEPMDLAPNVGVACLPPPREVADAGTRCTTTGWGKDIFEKKGLYQAALKKVDLPVVDRLSCITQLRKTRLGQKFELHSSFMCAGGEERDVCKGDGGAALSCPIQTEPGRYTQRGIVAWGIGCANGVPNVYVDVANVRAWIDDKVAGKGYDPKTYSY